MSHSVNCFHLDHFDNYTQNNTNNLEHFDRIWEIIFCCYWDVQPTCPCVMSTTTGCISHRNTISMCQNVRLCIKYNKICDLLPELYCFNILMLMNFPGYQHLLNAWYSDECMTSVMMDHQLKRHNDDINDIIYLVLLDMVREAAVSSWSDWSF